MKKVEFMQIMNLDFLKSQQSIKARFWRLEAKLLHWCSGGWIVVIFFDHSLIQFMMMSQVLIKLFKILMFNLSLDTYFAFDIMQ